MVRALGYRTTLVDPYRDYLSKRRAGEPAGVVTQLLKEIKGQGYTGSANLLVRYITRGRVEADHACWAARNRALAHPRRPGHHLDPAVPQRPGLGSYQQPPLLLVKMRKDPLEQRRQLRPPRSSELIALQRAPEHEATSYRSEE